MKAAVIKRHTNRIEKESIHDYQTAVLHSDLCFIAADRRSCPGGTNERANRPGFGMVGVESRPCLQGWFPEDGPPRFCERCGESKRAPMHGDKWYFSSPSFLTMRCPCFSPGRGIIWKSRHSRSKRNYFLRFAVLNSSRAAEYLIKMKSVEKMVRHADFWVGPLNDTGYWARIGKTTQGRGSSCARRKSKFVTHVTFFGHFGCFFRNPLVFCHFV